MIDGKRVCGSATYWASPVRAPKNPPYDHPGQNQRQDAALARQPGQAKRHGQRPDAKAEREPHHAGHRPGQHDRQHTAKRCTGGNPGHFRPDQRIAEHPLHRRASDRQPHAAQRHTEDTRHPHDLDHHPGLVGIGAGFIETGVQHDFDDFRDWHRVAAKGQREDHQHEQRDEKQQDQQIVTDKGGAKTAVTSFFGGNRIGRHRVSYFGPSKVDAA